MATEFAFEMIIYYGNDNNTILKDYYNKLINSDIDLDSKFIFFEPPKIYKNKINERNKEKLEKNISKF